MQKGITIFTATYNRGYCLPHLYQSLCNQTAREFEWLIIDDGSTDGTDILIGKWKNETIINIRYFWQENAGKAYAHNRAGELASRSLFTCVDSDDVLKPNAVERILSLWEKYPNKIGIISLKEKPNGRPMGYWGNRVRYCTLYDAYRKYGLRGETMLVYQTAIIKKYKFPRFEGEKFIQESYLYDCLDQEGKMYITNERFYIAEYHADGYTINGNRFFRENPYGHQAYIIQRLKLDHRLKYKVIDTILYISSKRIIRDNRVIEDSVYPVLTFLLYIPSMLYYWIKDIFLDMKNR